MLTAKYRFGIIGFVAAAVLLSCHQKETLFESLNPSKTNIKFVNKAEQHELFNILYYLYYYNGAGVATGDINNDGLPDIYFAANNNAGNKLYLNKGNFEFEDITEKAGVAGTADWCTGVTLADVNADGYLDIYVCAYSQAHGVNGRNQLFINNKNNTFTESAEKYGLSFSGFSTQAAFFDYDHDGDLDCYLLNQSQKPHANIADTINRHQPDPLAGDILYRNDVNTSGKFVNVSANAGIYSSNLGYGLGLAIADFNNDGWEDIYVGNDFHENDYYYINNHNGTFTEEGAKHFRHYSRFSMGNDAADYNNDGQIDLITVDMLPPDEKVLKTYGSDENPDIYKMKLETKGYQHQYSRNVLQQNNGNGISYNDGALINGVAATDWSWCPLFNDFDNDGNKDLFISSGIVKRPVDLDYIRYVSDLYNKRNVDQTDKFDEEVINKMPDGSSHPFLFKNTGNHSFTDASKDWGTADLKGYFNGAAYADLNNDGKLDIVINSLNASAVVLKNNTTSGNAISIAFKGNNQNTFGIGAKAYVYCRNQMQYQQLMLTRGFQSSSDARLHFGIGNNAVADSIIIVWPNGAFQKMVNVPAGKPLVAEQKNASGTFDVTSINLDKQSTVTASIEPLKTNWKHAENNFVDYNVQYLLPHAESTRGPKVAVADINGDGLEDIFACGAKGQPGTLMLQTQGGTFTPIEEKLFAADAAYEDVDAIFLDANGDKKLDLYVVSGGYEYKSGDPLLADRLYINLGNNHFAKQTQAIPSIYENKSTVSIADIDHDGDTDLFVGTLANANAYGLPQTSYLLLNNGKGSFSIAPKDVFDANWIGMVTTSVFTDINKDGWSDLIVAGEFMPITVYTNNRGKFQKKELPNTQGWWQNIVAEDVNNDGNIDLLAGNWGLNNKFCSNKTGMVKMYVADFGKGGQINQLLSYVNKDGKEYPFLAKDEVERPLPLLKKHYLLYADYAGVPMKEVFYGWIDTVKPLIANTLASAVAYGNGKGQFSLNNLPDELQMAPIFTFTKTNVDAAGNQYFLAGGNFFDVIPYEGRYDAQALTSFTIQKNNTVKVLPPNALTHFNGQIRDVKPIKIGGSNAVLVAPNNMPLQKVSIHF